MTQLILYTSEDGALSLAATDKESLSVQTLGGTAVSSHFRGVTKMVVYGKGSMHEVNDEATQ